MIFHPIEPVFNSDAEILILGSFPSVKSREQGFFYGHRQNRFWKVIAYLCGRDEPQSIDEKKKLLQSNGIAVWDVIHSCDIKGSSDSSITNVTVNDISKILNAADIRGIFANGARAYDLYMKYIFPENRVRAVKLPSTSPANASWSQDALIEKWSEELALCGFKKVKMDR